MFCEYTSVCECPNVMWNNLKPNIIQGSNVFIMSWHMIIHNYFQDIIFFSKNSIHFSELYPGNSILYMVQLHYIEPSHLYSIQWFLLSKLLLFLYLLNLGYSKQFMMTSCTTVYWLLRMTVALCKYIFHVILSCGFW